MQRGDDLPKHLARKLTRSIIEEPMLSPLIPVAALIELRKLLDSLHTAHADCQLESQIQEPGSADTTARLAQELQPADESRKHENQPTSFTFFNNIPR